MHRYPLTSATVISSIGRLTSSSHGTSDGLDSSSNGAVMPVTTDMWLRDRLAKSASEGKIGREASAKFDFYLKHMSPAVLKSIDAARANLGTNPDAATQYQLHQFGKQVGGAISRSTASDMRRSFEDGEADKKISEGEATGENYWTEASGFFSDFSIPSFLKDEVFEDMRRDRVTDPLTGLTAAETITEVDREMTDAIKNDLGKPRDDLSAAGGTGEKDNKGPVDNIPKF